MNAAMLAGTIADNNNVKNPSLIPNPCGNIIASILTIVANDQLIIREGQLFRPTSVIEETKLEKAIPIRNHARRVAIQNMADFPSVRFRSNSGRRIRFATYRIERLKITGVTNRSDIIHRLIDAILTTGDRTVSEAGELM